MTLTGFNQATQSFQVQIGGATSAVLGAGGAAGHQRNVAAAINGIPGFAGTVTSTGAGNGGFTLTFAAPRRAPTCRRSRSSTAPARAIGPRDRQGRAPLATWPAGATVVVGPAHRRRLHAHVQRHASRAPTSRRSRSRDGTGDRDDQGHGRRCCPAGATGTVAAFGGSGALADTGFQITFGAGLANGRRSSSSSASTARAASSARPRSGGPIDNQGHTVEATGNHAPVVETAAGYTIPVHTPFALTGSATDADGDTLTYMWEQNDRGGIPAAQRHRAGQQRQDQRPAVPPVRDGGERQPTDTLLSPSPGLNAVDTNPTRVFPDMAQILANNTNAVTGTCPPRPAAADARPAGDPRLLLGVPADRRIGRLPRRPDAELPAHRARRRPGRAAASRRGTKLTLAPDAGPFLVTSQRHRGHAARRHPQTVTWDVAGTDAAPVGTREVKISLLERRGPTRASSTPNDGSAEVTVPNVADQHARIKVEAIGNVFFDLSDADLASRPRPTSSSPTGRCSTATPSAAPWSRRATRTPPARR